MAPLLILLEHHKEKELGGRKVKVTGEQSTPLCCEIWFIPLPDLKIGKLGPVTGVLLLGLPKRGLGVKGLG